MRQSRSIGPGGVSASTLILAIAAAMLAGSCPALAQAPPPQPPRSGGVAAPPRPGSSPAAASAPAPGTRAGTATAGPRQVGDLTTRYRFTEKYTAAETKPKPTDIGLYRVGLTSVHRIVKEKPQGPPERMEGTSQIIYTERPAVVNNAGVVTDAVRRHDLSKLTRQPPDKSPPNPKPLDGLTVWYRPRPPAAPLIMSLSEGRPLSDVDYRMCSQLLFMPELAAVLPGTPVRVGDRWRLSKTAVKVLFNRTPDKVDPMYATLQDVRKSAKGTDQVAVIAVSGRGSLPPTGASHDLVAQILFAFPPPLQPAPSTPSAESKSDVVEAPGAITDLRLALSSASAVPGSNARLRMTYTNELILERQLAPAGLAALTIPATPPAPTEANSWLTYTDPDGRFHFRHPQDYLPDDQAVAEDENNDAVILKDRPAGRALPTHIRVELIPKTGNAEADRNQRDPDFHVKQLNEIWNEDRTDVLHGPTGWLPEAEWSPLKMKVFRIEAALKAGGAAGRNESRIFFDRYIVLFTRNECLIVTATTPKDPPLPVRKQVEAILKTFTLDGASKPGGD